MFPVLVRNTRSVSHQINSWSVFKTTARDTIFSVLANLLYYYAERWIISGYGIFNGVKNYLSKVLTDDIFANRLCAVIAPDSKVKEIDDNLLKELRDVLGQIVKREFTNDSWVFCHGKRINLPQKAVEGVYGVARDLYVYMSNKEKDTVGDSSTVDSDSPLLSRLTYKGKKLTKRLITDWDTEGIIVDEGWLKTRYFLFF